MKNLFLSLAFMLIGTIAYANTNNVNTEKDIEKIEITIESINNSTPVVLNFNSIESFNNFNNFDNLTLFNTNDYCTVNVSVTVSVGVASITLGASGVPCNQVKETMRRLLAIARESIMD